MRKVRELFSTFIKSFVRQLTECKWQFPAHAGDKTHAVRLLTSNIFLRTGSLDFSMAGCNLRVSSSMNGRLQRKTANQIVLSEAFRIIRPRRTLCGFLFYPTFFQGKNAFSTIAPSKRSSISDLFTERRNQDPK